MAKRDQQRRDAYTRLGIHPTVVASAPQISHLVKKLPGRYDRFFETLRGSRDENVRKFLAVFDELPKTIRQLLPLEAFCVAAAIDPCDLWGMFQAEALRQSSDHSSMLVAMHTPAVVEKTVEMALKDEGIDERKMLLQAAKVTPVPKGAVTNITLSAQAQSNLAAQTQAAGQLTPADAFVRELHEKFNQYSLGHPLQTPSERQLGAGTSETIPTTVIPAEEREAVPVAVVLPPEGDEA